MDVVKVIKDIDGMLRDDEARCLYNLAKNSADNIVEIGSWKGKSTVCLALGTKEKRHGRVYAVDPHKGIRTNCDGLYKGCNTEYEFRDNLKRFNVDDMVVPLIMESKEAARGWDKLLSLLFIDGAHDYQNVKQDFDLWFPHLSSGGFICFHDALYKFGKNYSGIRQVVIDEIFRSRKFANIKICGTMVYAQKNVEAIDISNDAISELVYRLSPLLYNPIALITNLLGR